MFHNHFFIKRLAKSLHQELKGLGLAECFSQNKDELILLFSRSGKEFCIRANLDPVVSLLEFPNSFARAGRNSVDLFSGLIGEIVFEVHEFQFERSFAIVFESGESLIFKMHARRANILHSDETETKAIFRKSLKQDLEVRPSELNQQIEFTKEAFAASAFDPLQMIPALGRESKVFLEKLNFTKLPDEQKWTALNGLLSDLESNPIALIDADIPRISLLELSDSTTEDPILASNWLYETSVRKLFFEKEKNQVINQLKQRIKKSENYIFKTRQKLQEIEEARNPEEIANVLMANLHHVQTGLSKVVLTDIYSDSPITIKLNTSLSPQKNAENYYRKAKNRHKEIEIQKLNIQTKMNLIDQLSKEILAVQEIHSSKELRKFKKSHKIESKAESKETNLPYHEYEIDGWKVLIGKNSRANDELTLKIASKNDLWLHAKDVAGSHVVVRQIPGQNFPKHVIEYAAGLAAGNSKRKTDSICPVIYTLKKFVRKVKGTPAGQVIVEKEDVVMIEPIRDQ